MAPVPVQTQRSTASVAESATSEQERIDAMVQTLNDEKASAYRCTAETNKILKKRDAREAGLTVCPFERVKTAFDGIVLMDDGPEKQAQIKQYNMIVTLFDDARKSPQLRAGMNQIFSALDGYYETKETVQREMEYLFALNKRHAILEIEKMEQETAKRQEARTLALKQRAGQQKRARSE